MRVHNVDLVGHNIRPDFSKHRHIKTILWKKKDDGNAQPSNLVGKGTLIPDQNHGKVKTFFVEISGQIHQKLFCSMGWKSRENMADRDPFGIFRIDHKKLPLEVSAIGDGNSEDQTKQSVTEQIDEVFIFNDFLAIPFLSKRVQVRKDSLDSASLLSVCE